MAPKTRRTVAVCATIVLVSALSGLTIMVVSLARNNGLDGLYKMLEAVL